MLGAMKFLIESMEEEQEFICPECESKEAKEQWNKLYKKNNQLKKFE